MTRKPDFISADPNDEEDFDVGPREIERALLAREVRRLRQKSGLSQAAFAERFDIALGTIRDWEQARVTPPLHTVAFLRIAIIGGTPLEELDQLRSMVA